MSDPLIPFNRPLFLEQGLANVRAAFDDWHVSGDGKYTRLCQAFFENHFDKAKVLLTTSCTDALELSALLLNLEPGDEVIMPSFTFVSTANAFALRGARPVFVDIRPDTFNLDESLLEAAITSQTKAVVVVHYAGVGCEMDAISSIAARHDLAVVEDNAHGLFGFYRDKPLGTFGQLATLSFHETKNLCCGEGGALVINDPRFVERAEILREKGTDRSRFYRGEIDKYTWRDKLARVFFRQTFWPRCFGHKRKYMKRSKIDGAKSIRVILMACGIGHPPMGSRFQSSLPIAGQAIICFRCFYRRLTHSSLCSGC